MIADDGKSSFVYDFNLNNKRPWANRDRLFSEARENLSQITRTNLNSWAIRCAIQGICVCDMSPNGVG